MNEERVSFGKALDIAKCELEQLKGVIAVMADTGAFYMGIEDATKSPPPPRLTGFSPASEAVLCVVDGIREAREHLAYLLRRIDHPYTGEGNQG